MKGGIDIVWLSNRLAAPYIATRPIEALEAVLPRKFVSARIPSLERAVSWLGRAAVPGGSAFTTGGTKRAFHQPPASGTLAGGNKRRGRSWIRRSNSKCSTVGGERHTPTHKRQKGRIAPALSLL